MSETFTSLWQDWTITLWMSNYSGSNWYYIASKGKFYNQGTVEATDRSKAFWEVASLLQIR